MWGIVTQDQLAAQHFRAQNLKPGSLKNLVAKLRCNQWLNPF